MQWFWFDPAVVVQCSLFECGDMHSSTVQWSGSAAAAQCAVVLICLIIYSHNLFINLITMRHRQRESNNQGFTVCVIMCGSHEIWSTAIMQISAGVRSVAAN